MQGFISYDDEQLWVLSVQCFIWESSTLLGIHLISIHMFNIPRFKKDSFAYIKQTTTYSYEHCFAFIYSIRHISNPYIKMEVCDAVRRRQKESLPTSLRSTGCAFLLWRAPRSTPNHRQTHQGRAAQNKIYPYFRLLLFNILPLYAIIFLILQALHHRGRPRWCGLVKEN